MSSEEYAMSASQYNERLGKIIQRKVELETRQTHFVNFSGNRLTIEKASIERLMRELQRSYLSRGAMDSGIYDNRMKSYVARLSEIEEAIAVAETKASSRIGLLGFLKPKKGLPAGKEALGAKEQPAGKGRPPKKKA